MHDAYRSNPKCTYELLIKVAVYTYGYMLIDSLMQYGSRHKTCDVAKSFVAYFFHCQSAYRPIFAKTCILGANSGSGQ